MSKIVGFEIAEKDLLLRGPGDIFSSVSSDNLRQSGGFEFRFAALCDSSDLLTKAFEVAKSIVAEDPDLEFPQHQRLREEINRRFNVSSANIS